MSFSKSINNQRQSQATKIADIRQKLHQSIITNYNTSQSYVHLKLISDVIAGQPRKLSITARDLQFNDGKQHMQKYYQATNSEGQLTDLFDYYQYYTQEPPNFLNSGFSYLVAHHNHRKAIVYQKLKKQLNISDSSKNQSTASKDKVQVEDMSNVLCELTKHYDESYYIAETLQRMVHHYGPSSSSLSQIDCQFKLMKENIRENKLKKKHKDFYNSTKVLEKNTLESTSTSIRNSTQKCIRNTHKRPGSCEFIKFGNCHRPGRIQRISADLNAKKMSDRSVATLKPNKAEGLNSIQILNEKQLKETIERFRCRIIKKKQNLHRQSTKGRPRKVKPKK